VIAAVSFSLNPLQDLQAMLGYDFMRSAFLAGGCIALAAGLVGYFVVLRNQVFTTDALGHVAFTGGLLFGLDLLIGVFGSCIAVALAIGTLGGRGRGRDVAIGTVFAWVLGLGVLFLSIYTTSKSAAVGIVGISVLFGSIAALSAWAPAGTGNLPLPARIVFANLATSGLAAIMDPAGPIPYRFEPFEVSALAAGQLPGSAEPLFQPSIRHSIRLRLPGPESLPLERSLAEALRDSGVSEAYLVASEADDGQRLLLGLVGGEGASVAVDVPQGTDVVWLEEPLLGSVRAVAEPFLRR